VDIKQALTSSWRIQTYPPWTFSPDIPRLWLLKRCLSV